MMNDFTARRPEGGSASVGRTKDLCGEATPTILMYDVTLGMVCVSDDNMKAIPDTTEEHHFDPSQLSPHLGA